MRKLDINFAELNLFRAFRMAFAGFLFLHFFLLFGHLEILFSERYLANDWAGTFNILSYLSSNTFLIVLNSAACIFAILIGFNCYRRLAAGIILYIHYCYLNKNLMILNVSYDYLGWMLLALILIPMEEKTDSNTEWKIPNYIWITGLLVFGLGYSLNGYLKFQSPLWRDGSALSIIIPNDRLLASAFIKEVLATFPDWLHKILTWVTMYAEFLCLPLLAFKRSRQFIWIVLFVLHMNALIIFKIKDLSLTMIYFSFFVGIGLQRNCSIINLLPVRRRNK